MYELTMARILAALDADVLLAKRALAIIAHVHAPINLEDLQQALAVADSQLAGPDGLVPTDLILAVCGGIVETITRLRNCHYYEEVRFVREFRMLNARRALYTVTEARCQITPPQNLSFGTSIIFSLTALILTPCSQTSASHIYQAM